MIVRYHDAVGTEGTWQLYVRNWIPLCLMTLLLLSCVATSDFSLHIDSVFCRLVLTAASFIVAGRHLISSKWATPLAVVFLSSAQIHVMLLLGTPISYVVASLNFPLQDANFAYYDQLLGLDWAAYYNFFMQRPALFSYAYIGYAMIGLLPIPVPLALGFTGHHERLQNFTLACILAVCATALISAIVPAIGAYQQYGLAADFPDFQAGGYLVQLRQLPFVRDGSLRSLYITQLGGIVTFPSFHAAAAILDMWALWGVWWMRPFALIANIGMLLATPLVGGHYFVDVLAGMAIAVLAITMAKNWRGRSDLLSAGAVPVAGIS